MMKKIIGIMCVIFIAACNNAVKTTKTDDSTTINTKTSSPADGGPDNGLSDTNTYNRINDTASHDTFQKK
jgi:hypothetical protein